MLFKVWVSIRCRPLSVSLEEDGDEIKIGTSCKNGGCTKVGERVTYGAEMCRNVSLSILSIGLWHQQLKCLNSCLNCGICQISFHLSISKPNSIHIFEEFLKISDITK